MVTEGELVLVQDEGEYLMRPGDCAAGRRRPNGHASSTAPTARASSSSVRRAAEVVTYSDVDWCYEDGADLLYRDGTPWTAPDGTRSRPRRPDADLHHRHRRRRRRHIAWDLPGKSMNVLTEEGIAELDAAIDAGLADPAVKGIVITSAKPDFAGGMDLNLLATHEGARRRRARARPLRRHHGHARAAPEDRARRHGPEDAQGRQADRLRPARPLRRHRHRDRASPATAASSPTRPRPGSACPRSSSASSPAPAAPPAWSA